MITPRDAVYCVVDREEDKTVKIRSTLIEKWLEEYVDCIVIDKSTINDPDPKCMLLTPYEYAVDADSMGQQMKSHHEGHYSYLKFRWLTDRRIVIPPWNLALLRRFHSDWYNLLDAELHTSDFIDFNKGYQTSERKKHTVYPERDKVYRAFDRRPDTTRVVIVGQDPYPGGEANGLAFAVDNGVKIPPSLQHIVEAVMEGKDSTHEVDTTLESWVKQGVMLLNSALSVKKGVPGSYSDDWFPFISSVITKLSEMPAPIIFVLMGRQAQNLNGYIDTTKHFVYDIEHPAAAAYGKRAWKHNNVFNNINRILTKQGSKPIEWTYKLPF